MNINSENIEIFILDYYDGNLDANAISELMQYLEQHSEAKELFESYENITLEADINLKFSDKENLKKNSVVAVGEISEHNFEEYCIQSIENILTVEQQTALSSFLFQNPQLQKTFETYKKTVLQPDLQVIYQDKELLKKSVSMPVKQSPLRRMIIISTSVAAVLAIVILSGIILNHQNFTLRKGNCLVSNLNSKKNFRKNNFYQHHNFNHLNTSFSEKDTINKKLEPLGFPDENPSVEIAFADKISIKKYQPIESSGNNYSLASSKIVKRTSTEIYNNSLAFAKRDNNKDTSNVNAGMMAYVVKGIKTAARKTAKDKNEIKDNKKIGFWDVAGAGVYVYNKITDENLTLDRKMDASGRLISFNLGDKFAYSREKK